MTADLVRSMNSEVADGPAAMIWVPPRRPDVVLVDAKWPALDGIEVPRWMHAASPAIRVLGIPIGADPPESLPAAW